MVFYETVAVQQRPLITKRAFQNRFPVASNGVSTKYDILSMFLTNEAFATSLIATAPERQGLQLLIQTGINRLNASPFVDLAKDPDPAILNDAEKFTGLLMQPSIPTLFRLTLAERALIIDPDTIKSTEHYTG